MQLGAGFRSVFTSTPPVAGEIAARPSLLNAGVDNVAAITGSDVGITNGCLGRYLRTAAVVAATLRRAGRKVFDSKNGSAQK